MTVGNGSLENAAPSEMSTQLDNGETLVEITATESAAQSSKPDSAAGAVLAPGAAAPIGLVDTLPPRGRRWTALESITVKNFKATDEAIIPLGQVTILVGPNGCGKSSVLQAIHWAARAASYVMKKNSIRPVRLSITHI